MTPRDILAERFRKLLTGRNSPQNKCFVKDGDILYPPPPAKGLGAKHGASHEFLSVVDNRTHCKFGWVRVEEMPFSVGEFLQKYSLDASPEQIEVLFEMFRAIAPFPEGTPVAGSYFSRGIEDRKIVLSFHKVVLHRLQERRDE